MFTFSMLRNYYVTECYTIAELNLSETYRNLKSSKAWIVNNAYLIYRFLAIFKKAINIQHTLFIYFVNNRNLVLNHFNKPIFGAI
jgi:hypothetical protein